MAMDHEAANKENKILYRAIKAIDMAYMAFKKSDMGDTLTASKIVGSLTPKIYDELKELDKELNG